jgi:hypothetical protein
MLSSFYLISPFILQKGKPSHLKRIEKILFKIVHKGHQKKTNFALVLERCIDLMLNDDQKRFHIKTFFREFLGTFLDARVMHLLEKSENCASFDTLRTMIYEIKPIQKGLHGCHKNTF